MLELEYLASGRKINLSETQQVKLEENFQCLHSWTPHDISIIAYCLVLPKMAVTDWFERRLQQFPQESGKKDTKKGKQKKEGQGTTCNLTSY